MSEKNFFIDTLSVYNTRNIKNHLPLIEFVVIVILVAVAGYFFYSYQTVKTQPQNNPTAAQKAAVEQAKKLADEVGKLMVLPTDETPTVATVTDVTKLEGQQFFKNAKNGDKVLIYTNAKKAVLYDPILHKIKEVGPVNIGSQITPSMQAKVALRNGKTVPGLAAKTEQLLQKAFPVVTIASKEQAKKTDYDKTVVVVLNDNVKNVASDIAATLSATLSSLPSGEIKPSGIDIVIILGKNRL